VTFAKTEAFGMSMELEEGKYRIELVGTDNEGASFQQILFRHDNLALARSMYKACVERYSGRLILLCEAQVLARSDLLKITP
jgi:hypothetical protein